MKENKDEESRQLLRAVEERECVRDEISEKFNATVLSYSVKARRITDEFHVSAHASERYASGAHAAQLVERISVLQLGEGPDDTTRLEDDNDKRADERMQQHGSAAANGSTTAPLRCFQPIKP